MKIRISKAEFDALSDALKLIYVADGEGFFKLPLAAGEDPGELRRALDRERIDAKEAKAALLTANNELTALRAASPKTGDIATLEKSWQDKLTASETASTAKIATLKSSLEKVLIDGAANQVAGAITAKPENASLMLPHIRNRFEVVYDGDVATVKIKDGTGRISAMNFDELQKELVATPTFSSIVVASKASGAGGAGAGNGGSGGAGSGKKFAEMTGVERTALYQSNRAEFDRLAAVQKTEANARKFGTPKLFKTA